VSKRFSSILAAILGATVSLHAEEFYCVAHGVTHGSAASPFAPGGERARRYAPDRMADFLHLRLDVTPDFKERSITGSATITFKPLGKPLEQLRLDAEDLRVISVTSLFPIKGYQATDHEIVVTFDPPLAVGSEQTITIDYKAYPENGLFFRTPELGYKEGETHLYTQGETYGERHWYPMFDAPNDKLTTEIVCHVPADMNVYANGHRTGTETNSSTGLVAHRWLQDKPHANYLVCLVAGYFKSIEDTHGDVPLAFIVPPDELPLAANSFRFTKEMMAFFEKETGHAYPWDKYFQVVTRDFQAGGMENTTLTVLTDRTLFSDASETLGSSEGLVAHELAHQWFGDLVTCKDWSHLWLNEGFATYYDALFVEAHRGRDEFRYNMLAKARTLTAQTNNTRAIVTRVLNPDAGDQFNGLVYGKGSWILHMLRSEFGPDLYRKAVVAYLEKHKFQPVVTEDLLQAFEETTGRSLDRFFDQWLYHGGNPALKAAYTWDDKTGIARVSVRQTQPVTDEVLDFQFPLTLRFKGAFGTVDKVVQIDERSADFEFAFPSAPQIVRLDPEVSLLASIDFVPPRAMTVAQLADTSDPLGRINAMERLAKDKAPDTLKLLREVLNSDERWFVRAEAAKTLGKVGTTEALAALQASLKQSEARARKAVVDAIAGFTEPAALLTLTNVLATEKNPEIIGAASRGLAQHPGETSRKLLIAQLGSRSVNEHLFDAAVAAMRELDDPAFIAPLSEAIERREKDLVGRSLMSALNTLGYLARNEDDKSAVSRLLLAKTRHLREAVALGAINGLGQLKDPAARSTLAALAVTARNDRFQNAAETAVKALDKDARPAGAIPDLRSDVLELQKTNKELKADLEKLKQRIETLSTQPAKKAKKN
jgi:aminopeptidase N